MRMIGPPERIERRIQGINEGHHVLNQLWRSAQGKGIGVCGTLHNLQLAAFHGDGGGVYRRRGSGVCSSEFCSGGVRRRRSSEFCSRGVGSRVGQGMGSRGWAVGTHHDDCEGGRALEFPIIPGLPVHALD